MLGENSEKLKTLSLDELKDLKKIIKKYTNIYKALYLFDPALSSEFKSKNEFYLKEKQNKAKKNHVHSDENNSCCSDKSNNKMYIPRDKQNNIEKVLSEIYETLLYPDNLNELLSYLSEKLNKILKSGLKDGLKLDIETEKQLIHKMCVEGIPFFILEKIKVLIKKNEESISEQPLLLAHPSGVKNIDLINMIDPYLIENLVKNNYFYIDKKLYNLIDEYKTFDEFKYLYAEGYFEDISMKNPHRKDLIYKYNIHYFKNSKHRQIYDLSNLIYNIPYELNSKLPILSLQTNDYILASFFKEKSGCVKINIDSSFSNDSGKKITAIIPLFSRDLELSKRKISIKLYEQKDLNDNNDKENKVYEFIDLTKPLSLIVLKSRILAYEVDEHDFPFILLFYFIHGPIDRNNFEA